MAPILQGRSLCTIADLSLDEILYLHRKTAELKRALSAENHLNAKEIIGSIRIDDPDFGLYEIFLENSTRTHESFKQAAKWHHISVDDQPVTASSLKKEESYEDNFNTLSGYDTSMFVVRSGLEGMCRWLDIAGREYSSFHGDGPRVFINAGDGKHEHPTQELLDGFTFLEHLKGDMSHIRLALVGDLKQGRTVHSKVDGLRIFNEVEVDLVAPEELAMPPTYIERMKVNGFKVNTFSSVQEYLAQATIAPLLYMTRFQAERSSDALKEIKERLLRETSLQPEMYRQLIGRTTIFHPLPRVKVNAEIPRAFDRTPLNGYEGQSRNGRYSRIVLIAALAGRIGHDFSGDPWQEPEYNYDHITPGPTGGQPKHTPTGINPIADGWVIDRAGTGETAEEVFTSMVAGMVALGLPAHQPYCGTPNGDDGHGKPKGLIVIPRSEGFEPDEHYIHKVAAVFPGATLNVISGSRIVEKHRLGDPPLIYNFDEISCRNDACISYDAHQEPIPPEHRKFIRRGATYDCHFCDTPHTPQQLWERR